MRLVLSDVVLPAVLLVLFQIGLIHPSCEPDPGPVPAALVSP